MYYQPNYYQPVATPQLYPSSSISSQQQQQTVQNDGELIRVNGISGAYQCQLPANTKSIIVPDAEQSIVYLIKVNGLNREVFAYDISPHHEPEPAPVTTNNTVSPNTLEQTLQNLTTEISSMKEEINELKSNTGRTGSSDAAKPKYNNKSGNGSNAASH